MKPYLLLVSHGMMAEETLRSAEMITGPIATAAAVCMSVEDGLTGFHTKLLQAVKQWEGAPIMVVADLYGGTPCNVTTTTLLQRADVRLVAGMNLAMVIEYAGSAIEDLEELAELLAAIGKVAIREVVLPETDDDEDEIG